MNTGEGAFIPTSERVLIERAAAAAKKNYVFEEGENEESDEEDSGIPAADACVEKEAGGCAMQ